MGTRSLDDLCPSLRPRFMELLARWAEAGVPVMVINILRTPEEQAINLGNGTSWTLDSKHLPQVDCPYCGIPAGGTGLSHAMDGCPYEIYRTDGPDKLDWDANDPVWQKMGAIGERVGFTGNMWGGNWIHHKDFCHFSDGG